MWPVEYCPEPSWVGSGSLGLAARPASSDAGGQGDAIFRAGGDLEVTMSLDLGVSVTELIVGSSLLVAGVRKLVDIEAARAAVLDYRLVPLAASAPFAVCLSALELLIGAALIMGISLAASLAILLLGAFSAAAINALVRRLDIDCHCAGPGERVSFRTLARNGALALALAGALVLRPTAPLYPSLAASELSYVLAVALALAAFISASAAAAVSTQRERAVRP